MDTKKLMVFALSEQDQHLVPTSTWAETCVALFEHMDPYIDHLTGDVGVTYDKAVSRWKRGHTRVCARLLKEVYDHLPTLPVVIRIEPPRRFIGTDCYIPPEDNPSMELSSRSKAKRERHETNLSNRRVNDAALRSKMRGTGKGGGKKG